MQVSSQIDEPDYGTLLDDMFFEPGDIHRPLHRAAVEVELAFILAQARRRARRRGQVLKRPSRHASHRDHRRAHQFDRHTKAMRKVQDTIMTTANAGIVLAGADGPEELDLPWCGAILRRTTVENRPGRRRAGPPRSASPGWR
jgi:2-oxo-hept-3-ene-1,7-dioate hydratase